MRQLLVLLLALITTAGSTFAATTASQPKEWTFLIFLNGNNNLDSFGKMNIKQMEKVGPGKNINILAQWASLSTRKVERLLIKKVGGTNVGSTVIQSLPGTDMGDWHSVVDFVKWGVQNYPAQHYFLDIWDHGSGWHDKNRSSLPGGPQVMDISWDELTGNHITTQQLGLALTESAKIIGHKIDLYASDACLMAMAEIAQEMSDSVSIYAGSEETEPGAGWPYDTFISRWNATKNASARDVAKILSEEYAKSYQHGNEHVTFSAFDLAALPAFNQSLKAFGQSITRLDASAKKQVIGAVEKSQYFTNSDYVDFLDFSKNLKSTSISSLNTAALNSVTLAAQKLIITSNNVGFPNATGMSLWIPSSYSTYAEYADRYSQLKFNSETNWATALQSLLK